MVDPDSDGPDDEDRGGRAPVRPRLAQVVADAVRTRIVRGELKDGDRLPNQESLLREFGVSHPSLREALRILESEGLVAVQRGNVGGAIVRRPSVDAWTHMFGLVLQSRHVTLAELAQTIRTIEPIAASLCAARSDRRREVLPRLRKANKAMAATVGTGPEFTDAARLFHEECVNTCGNSTLIIMLGALERMWSLQIRQLARQDQAVGTYPGRESLEPSLGKHEAIYEAIRAGDEDLAARLSRIHLVETQRWALGHDEDLRVQVATTWQSTAPS